MRPAYNPFECCHLCVAPKRHPGCHDHCDEYKTAKENDRQYKLANEADREARIYTGTSIAIKQDNLAKRRKTWRNYGRYK